MVADLSALLDKPLVLLVVLALGAAIGMSVEKFWSGMERERRQAYWRGRNSNKGKKPGKLVPTAMGKAQSTDLAADQLRTVMNADFKHRALLNKPERRLLGVIDKALEENSPGWRAMGQVSLGEILYSPDKDAFWAINSKRVDLLIVDADCKPLHAVEFQGTGHHTGPEAAARDAVKKEALRRAGIGYVEVVSGDTPAEVRGMVRKMVGRLGA